MTGGIEAQVFEYSSIGRVLFGAGAVEQVGAEATRLVSGRKCLIVTDPGIVKAGLIDGILRSLEQGGFTVDVCDRAEAEPTVSTYRTVLATGDLGRRRANPGCGCAQNHFGHSRSIARPPAGAGGAVLHSPRHCRHPGDLCQTGHPAKD
jgi:hypothetical protein